MDIVIDSGNTHTKIGIFHGNVLKQTTILKKFSEVVDFANKCHPDDVIVSTVKFKPDQFKNGLLNTGKLILLDHQTPIPIKNTYLTPETLGMDRLASVVGAWHLYPDRPSLVIDAGACTTFDVINDIGEYLGGSISPGIDIRLQSMYQFTENLPKVEKDGFFNTPGRTTEEAIKSGAIDGAISEAEGFIQRYHKIFNNMVVILTGGQYKLFESKIKGNIFAVPNLVMRGLYTILSYNV